MAMRVRHTVVPIKSPADTARGRSRAQPPKAVAQRASLEPARAGSDHQKPKRRLTLGDDDMLSYVKRFREKTLGRQNLLATERAFRRSIPGGADGQNINPRAAGSGRGAVADVEGVPGLRSSDAPALR